MAIACALAAGACAAPAQGAGARAAAPAYGEQCHNQSTARPAGATRPPFATCVAAMARLSSARSRSPQIACASLGRRRAAGARRSAFQKCVAAGRSLIRHGNGVDRAYVEAMIPHHVGAIEMAQLALSRTQEPFLKTLAQSIVTSQNAEIARMRAMAARLRAAGIKPISLGLTTAQMGMDHDISHLVAADRFDVAFVDMMVPHHQGAITMSRVVSRRGVGAAVKRLAEQITESQAREIRQMRDVRAFLTGAAEPAAGEGAHTHPGSTEPHPH